MYKIYNLTVLIKLFILGLPLRWALAMLSHPSYDGSAGHDWEKALLVHDAITFLFWGS